MDLTMTSFADQTELLVLFATFRTAAAKELQMELIIPFWTIRSAETEEGKQNCSSRFGPFMQQKLHSSVPLHSGGGLRPMSTRWKDLEV